MSGMDRLMELLPCPFCGGEAYLSDAEAGTGGLSTRARNPRCWKCGVDLGYCDTAVEAAAAWNRRASQAAPATGAEPQAVRYSFDGDGWLYQDSGNGSDWLKRAMSYPDAEPLYDHPAPSDGLREALEAIRDGYGPNHLSKFALAIASAALMTPAPAQEGGAP